MNHDEQRTFKTEYLVFISGITQGSVYFVAKVKCYITEVSYVFEYEDKLLLGDVHTMALPEGDVRRNDINVEQYLRAEFGKLYKETEWKVSIARW